MPTGLLTASITFAAEPSLASDAPGMSSSVVPCVTDLSCSSTAGPSRPGPAIARPVINEFERGQSVGQVGRQAGRQAGRERERERD